MSRIEVSPQTSSQSSVLNATTVGNSFIELADPSAITFPRINANNTVSALSASDFKTSLSIGVSRETLTANRTYYVRVDGNNSNTGLINSAGGAFLTIQKAVDAAAELDTSIYDVTIQIADGTYTENVLVSNDLLGSGFLTIQGNSSATSNVIITATSGTTFIISTAKRIAVKWIKLTGTGSVICNFVAKNHALVILTSINHQAQVGQAFNQSQAGSLIYITGDRILQGACSYADYCDGATIYNYNNTTTLTDFSITGTFASIGNLNSGGTILYQSVVFSGTATGKRYETSRYAVINTLGQLNSYLPGNIAGTATNGGLYL